MRNLLSDSLHIFIIIMIAAFIVGGILAVTGTFDHWGSRYILKRRRNRLLRNGRSNISDVKEQQEAAAAPYHSNGYNNSVAGKSSKNI